MPQIETLIPESRAFLTELAANNSREWFAANKTRYDSALKAPAQALLDQLAADLSRQTGQPVETKLFRPHRDVRFSKDKTPYHLHLHMLWSTPGMGWFFGISPDYISAGGGCMGFDKPALAAFRSHVDDKGTDVQALVDQLADRGLTLREAELKRVPAPYDKDHPQAPLLRRKSLTFWHDFDAPPQDLQAALAWVFQQLDPVRQLLAELT